MVNFPILPGDRVFLNWPVDMEMSPDDVMDLLAEFFPQVEFRVYVGDVKEPRVVFVLRDEKNPFVRTDDATSYVGIREQ